MSIFFIRPEEMSRKARAVSPSPRRLSTVMRARIARQITSVYGTNAGKAETKEPTPAAIETATVRV